MKRIKASLIYIFISIILIWTGIIFFLTILHDNNENEMIFHLAKTEAKSSYEKDVLYRKWASAKGGFYVDVAKNTPPNPYLINVNERDITTPSGKHLTLVNPAYMTRMVHELDILEYCNNTHVTSLKPLRPENKADKWESYALKLFEKGDSELYQITTQNNKTHLRFMKPLTTEKSCLTCHAFQGYKVGDIRGGISVSVPYAPYQHLLNKNILIAHWGYSLLWIIVVIGLLFLWRTLFKIMSDLEYAKLKAVESDKLKSAFLANMSHEIRTPMNAILGFSSLLNNDNLAREKKEKYINLINNSGNQLMNIINDLIDISKIESNQITISKQTVDLTNLITNLHSTFQIQLAHKQVELITTIPQTSITCNTDELRLIQILTNLIGNAIKFTKEGNIKFGYALNGNSISFSVSDTGVGIAEDKLNLIFNRFRQAEDDTAQLFGGTGLGLTISKALIELLGGKIWVTSEINKGTTFYFTIPFDKPKTI